MTTKPFAAAGLGLLLATSTQAAELGFWQKLELHEACGRDVQTLCAAIAPGEGRLAQCFRDNEEKLSRGCAQAIATLRADLLEERAPMDF